MSGPAIRQTLYARSAWTHQPASPPIFPFLSPSAIEMYVVDAAGRSVAALAQVAAVELIIELGSFIGPNATIAHADVWLLESGGVDIDPDSRRYNPATIIARNGRRRQAIRQLLYRLQPEGQYIAWASVVLADGGRSSYVAPFSVGEGNASFGYILNDDGSAILSNERNGNLLIQG